MTVLRWGAAAAAALADLFWPERCALCGAEAGAGEATAWAAAGPAVGGLRRWDRPHLCRACLESLPGRPLLRRLALEDGVGAPPAGEPGSPRAGERGLPLAAGRPESAPLVQLVAAAKYHGLRGLLWPLAEVAAAAAPLALGAGGECDLLVPVPLHQGRRRQRGYNQAEVLAALLAVVLGRPAAARLLRRSRPTGQQARIPSGDARRRANVAGAFAAAAPPPGAGLRVGLVDDLATSGQTVAAAAAALQRAGWRPVWALVVGAAAAAPAGLDTRESAA